jgi:hypothetical protein
MAVHHAQSLECRRIWIEPYCHHVRTSEARETAESEGILLISNDWGHPKDVVITARRRSPSVFDTVEGQLVIHALLTRELESRLCCSNRCDVYSLHFDSYALTSFKHDACSLNECLLIAGS